MFTPRIGAGPAVEQARGMDEGAVAAEDDDEVRAAARLRARR